MFLHFSNLGGWKINNFWHEKDYSSNTLNKSYIHMYTYEYYSVQLNQSWE